MPDSSLFKDSDLSLEVVILLFAAMAMLLVGILLFPVNAGILPFDENGLFGLLLVIFALQTLSMGKTQFGDFQRSGAVLVCGVVIAAIGIVTCFIPGIFAAAPRILLIVFFGAGGFWLLLQMLFAEEKYRLWRKTGGIFNHLILGCGAVYLLEIVIAVLLVKPGRVTTPQMASAVFFFGLSLVYLSFVLQKISRLYPSVQKAPTSDGGPSMDNAILLLMGIFMLLLGLLLVQPGRVTTPQMASAVFFFGLSLVYLSCVLQKISRLYPSVQKAPTSDGGPSMDNAILLLMGIFMLLLGLLLVPVNLGLLPFSGSAQLGLLMVIFAIQMLAIGSTPIGAFPRTWLMVVFGFVFAALGIVSCIIPGILVTPLTFLVGVLNVAGGIIGIVKVAVPFLKGRKTAEPVPPILRKINTALLVMNMLTILFGVAMLVSGLIPGLIVGIVLAANGCVLLYLLHQLMFLEKVQAGNQQS